MHVVTRVFPIVTTLHFASHVLLISNTNCIIFPGGRWENECQRMYGRKCGANALCVTGSDGQSRCQCNDGYVGYGFICRSNDHWLSTLEMTLISSYFPFLDGCRNRYGRPCSENASCRKMSDNNYQCSCNSGYFGNGLYCARKFL